MPMWVAVFSVFVITGAISCTLGALFWVNDPRPLERLGGGAPGKAAGRALPSWTDLLELAARLSRSAANSAGLRKQLMVAGYNNPAAVDWFHGAQVTGGFAMALAGLALTAALNLSGTSFAATVMAASLFGFRVPYFLLSRRRAHRARELVRALPNTVDLLIVCIESGLGVDQALRMVAKELAEAHPELSRELVLLNAEIAAGNARSEALRRLAERTAVDDIRDLASALIQADRFGTSICQTLRTRSDFIRVQARQRAEEKAAKLGVKLILPIFFFVLPTLFVVTLGPAIFQLVTELAPLVNSM
jgi:tight adherence protein C